MLLHFWQIILWFFRWKYGKIICVKCQRGAIEKSNEVPGGLQNKQNVSQIWHRGFKRATAAMQAIF